MPEKNSELIELLPLFRERVWGRESLEPFFSNEAIVRDEPNTRIGEVWYTFKDNFTSVGKTLGQLLRERPELLGTAYDPQFPGVCPILVKLLFTSERLSVQVHPSDDYAREHHQSLGKTEAWYVLRTQEPGELAAGLREKLSPERFRAAIASGEIEALLDWRRVDAGEVVFVPAGTVHAIGAGLTICEIQENSDITYRLYDYGRPRELHLEHGVKVSELEPKNYETKPIPLGSGREELLACSYFRIERLRPADRIALAMLPHYALLICVAGEGHVSGEACSAGQAWFVPAGAKGVRVEGSGSEWILTCPGR